MNQSYKSWKRISALILLCLFFYFSNSTPTPNSSNFFFTAAGVISSSQIICDGDAPAMLIETAAPTIAGPFEYLWMEATPGNPWVPIPGATGMSFTPPPSLSETTKYTRCVRLAGSSDDYIETNVVTITVVENSVASIVTAPGSGNVGQVLSFSAASSPSSTYSWDFGDGTPTTDGQSAIHIFGSNGNVSNTYTVTLTVTNGTCTQTTTSTITIIDVALPIDLLFFEAQDTENGTVDLKWATASEQNNEYFDLERSNDGRNFSSIEKQDGAVNSNQIIYYSFQDETPANGDNYYRLKQVDTNGDFEYSEIVSVRIKDGLTGFSFYPNPVKKELNVKFSTSLSDKSTLEIFNMDGQLMRIFDLKNYLQTGISIDLENLNAGTYLVLVKDKNENIYTDKILKLD